MECKFCKKVLSTNSSLNVHQKRTRSCLKIQGKTIKGEFICKLCGKDFQVKFHLQNHQNICEKNIPNIEKLQRDNDLLKKENEMLKIELEKFRSDYKELSITAMSQNFEDETTIEIDDNLPENLTSIENPDSDSDEETEEYKLTPLEVGQGFTIEHREEDGYINVTNLCKAGGKQFRDWNRLVKTKAFLQALSTDVLISTSVLIHINKGGNDKNNQGTWVHPQIAINIAQWISPKFDVKVSGWVYEIMMTGKVDITNTKSFKELQRQNKTKDIKIQYLTKKYVKAQPSVQYEERNVVYILTTKLMKKERRYILGKATNLTNRLSVYNKSDEHEVVYYASCGDENTMGCVENMVFQYLKNYREQANRERFVLPKEEEIGLFSDIINKSVEFFNK
jgi:hypothetical protein